MRHFPALTSPPGIFAIKNGGPRSRNQRLAEGKALLMLGTALQYRDGVSAALPVSIALAAGHRFRQAVAADRSSAGNWTLLGTACWILSGDVRATPPGPDEPWEIARGIFLRRPLIATSTLLR